MNTAKGSVVRSAVKGAPISSSVEFTRAAALGGASISDRRFREVSDAVEAAKVATRSYLEGLADAAGPLRVEVTFALEARNTPAVIGSSSPPGVSVQGALEYMIHDLVYRIAEIEGGCRMPSEAFYALSPSDVSALAHGEAVRCLEAMRYGIKRSGHGASGDGDLSVSCLPLGHLPSVGERILQHGALVFRSPVVGRALRRGLKMFGVAGEDGG